MHVCASVQSPLLLFAERRRAVFSFAAISGLCRLCLKLRLVLIGRAELLLGRHTQACNSELSLLNSCRIKTTVHPKQGDATWVCFVRNQDSTMSISFEGHPFRISSKLLVCYRQGFNKHLAEGSNVAWATKV